MHGAIVMTENVTTDGKQCYYSRRAAQERELAMRTSDRSARRVHDELASRYAVLAAESAKTQCETA
jgi:hypothetical protein